MPADFNFYLNRQGVRGKKGDKGDKGFSPNISIGENTQESFTLVVQNEFDTFETPNLKEGLVPEDRNGTYVRLDRGTGQQYYGEPDIATESTSGVIKLATQDEVNAGEEETKAVTPDTLAVRLTPIETNITNLDGRTSTLETQMTVAESNITTLQTQMSTAESDIDTLQSQVATNTNNISALTGRTSTLETEVTAIESDLNAAKTNITSLTESVSTIESDITEINADIAALEGSVSTLETQMPSIATTTTAGTVKPDGTTITITDDGTITAVGGGGGGAGDVTAAGDNTFTGSNKFVKSVELPYQNGSGYMDILFANDATKSLTTPTGESIQGNGTSITAGLKSFEGSDPYQYYLEMPLDLVIKADGDIILDPHNATGELSYGNVIDNNGKIYLKQDTITAGSGITVSETSNGVQISTTSSGDTTDYNQLTNKPTINNIELEGDLTGIELGLAESQEVEELGNELNELASTVTNAAMVNQMNNFSAPQEITLSGTDRLGLKINNSNSSNESADIFTLKAQDLNILTTSYDINASNEITDVKLKFGNVPSSKLLLHPTDDVNSDGLQIAQDTLKFIKTDGTEVDLLNGGGSSLENVAYTNEHNTFNKGQTIDFKSYEDVGSVPLYIKADTATSTPFKIESTNGSLLFGLNTSIQDNLVEYTTIGATNQIRLTTGDGSDGLFLSTDSLVFHKQDGSTVDLLASTTGSGATLDGDNTFTGSNKFNNPISFQSKNNTASSAVARLEAKSLGGSANPTVLHSIEDVFVGTVNNDPSGVTQRGGSIYLASESIYYAIIKATDKFTTEIQPYSGIQAKLRVTTQGAGFVNSSGTYQQFATSADLTNLGAFKYVVMTADEYAGLGTKDPDTLYRVTTDNVTTAVYMGEFQLGGGVSPSAQIMSYKSEASSSNLHNDKNNTYNNNQFGSTNVTAEKVEDTSNNSD